MLHTALECVIPIVRHFMNFTEYFCYPFSVKNDVAYSDVNIILLCIFAQVNATTNVILIFCLGVNIKITVGNSARCRLPH